MKNTFDFTGQGKADAVVPLLVGPLRSLYASPVEGAPADTQNLWIPDNARRPNEWDGYWGVFKWTRRDFHRPLIAEVWGMRSFGHHDFCGGSVAASFGCWVYMPECEFDYGQSCFVNKGVRYFAQMRSYDDYLWLPDIANAFAEEPTQAEVEECLFRSLVFWMLGRGNASNRIAITAFDRTDGYVTRAFNAANTLRYIPTNLFPISGSNEMSPHYQDREPADRRVAEWYTQPEGEDVNEDYGSGTALRCDPTGGPVTEFINQNSHRRCAVLHMTPNKSTRVRPTPEGGTPYLNDRSMHMMFPQWWSDAASTNRYDRMFPRGAFSH